MSVADPHSGSSDLGRERGLLRLNGNGTVTAVGVPFFGNDVFPWDIARDIQVTPDGQGYVVLDGLGAVHPYGSAQLPAGSYPYWPGWDVARSLAG